MLGMLRRLRALDSALAPGGAAPAVEQTATEAGVEPPSEMSAREKFMWDLEGFLVVEGFLSPQEVDALNNSFDANWGLRHDCHQTPAYDEFTGMLQWPQPSCQPFRDMLAHPKLIPYMNTFFGRGWKLDHAPFMITGDTKTKLGKKGFSEASPGGGRMHGSTSHIHNGSQYYTYSNGVMRNGMIVAAFQLRSIDEGDGGFGERCNPAQLVLPLSTACFYSHSPEPHAPLLSARPGPRKSQS